jgi:hypothetical protein
MHSSDPSLPILYRDASWVGVFFEVDLKVAGDTLRPHGLEPWDFFGRALGAIYAWDYRDSSIGPYAEVGLGLQAKLPGTRPSLLQLGWDMLAQDHQGIWVETLPVTTTAACDAGIEVWGYPKYVTNIQTDIRKEGSVVTLGEELVLRVPRATVFEKHLPIATYSRREGELLRTSIEVDTRVRLATSGSLTLLGGSGATKAAAKRFDLDKARVLGAFHGERFVARLPAGRSLPTG